MKKGKPKRAVHTDESSNDSVDSLDDEHATIHTADLISETESIHQQCTAELTLRLQTISSELELNNSKQKVIDLLLLIKKRFFSNIKL